MRMLSAAVAFAIALLCVPIAAQNLESELQRAIQKETTTGDLKAAIEEYRKIAARAGANRALAAQALMRMADCHQKLGDAESRAIYERVIRDFADQTEPVNQARARLAAARKPAASGTGRAFRQIWTGADGMGAPTADGHYITFTDWDTGDLAVRDLVAGTSRHLTNTGGWQASGDFAEFSVPSPDGKLVASAWFTEKNATKPSSYDLRVVPMAGTDGGKPRVVYAREDLQWVWPVAWTPDGRSLLVIQLITKQPYQLALVPVADGTPRVLKTLAALPSRVSLSPDGRYAALDVPAAGTPSQRDVVLLSLRDGSETPVVRHAADDHSALWAPDGSRLLFTSTRTGNPALWALRMRDGRPDGEPELLATEVRGLVQGIDRDGTLYTFSGGEQRNVYVTPLDGSGKALSPGTLVSARYVNSTSGASWSPDGRQVAYYSQPSIRDGNPGPAAVVICTVATGEERAIPLKGRTKFSLWAGVSWFPGGGAVLIAFQEEDLAGFGLYKLDLSSGAMELLAKTRRRGAATGAPALAADGSAIFYVDAVEDQPGVTVITRFDMASRTARELKRGWIHAVNVSPDGGSIAYLGNDEGLESRKNHVAVMPAGGGASRVLFEADWYDSSRFASLGWTRDSKYVLFVRTEPRPGTAGQASAGQALWRVPVAGGAPEKVGISAGGRIKHPEVHPDGSRMLYSATDSTPAELWVLEHFLPAAARSKPVSR